MFKDIFNLMAGEMFFRGGPDWFLQQLQVAIIMIGSNPFIG